jgi:beta-galactosidase
MVASFKGSDVDGSVAIAKRKLASSTAWYQGTELTLDSQKKFFADIAKSLGIESEGGDGVEIIRRGPFKFKIDHIKNTVKVKK